MKTEKQNKAIDLYSSYYKEQYDQLISLCELAVELSNSYEKLNGPDGNGVIHGDNLEMRIMLNKVMNHIKIVLDMVYLQVTYEEHCKIKDSLYEKYFKDLKGFKVQPGGLY